MKYIGVDLHKDLIVACYLDIAINKYTHKSFKMNDLDKFQLTLDLADELCFEATANSSWFYSKCEKLVSKVVIVNTNEFGVIAKSVKKTDKHDAKALALYLSKNMLPIVRFKTLEQQDLQSIFNTRKLLTKQITMLKNQIHGILLTHGFNINPADLDSKIGLARTLKLCDRFEVNHALSILLDLLSILAFKISELDTKLDDLAQKLPGYTNLKSIFGLGTNTIALLLITIGNINDFSSYKKLLAYIGLVPRVRNSNQSSHYGGITRRGNATLRGNLVMCAMVAIKKNKILKGFYERIKMAGGYKKAIVATANKLVKLIYYTLKHGWYFTDRQFTRESLQINWPSNKIL